MGHAVISNIVRCDVDTSRADNQGQATNHVVDRATGAIVIGVTGEDPLICSVVTSVGMSRAAQIEKVT
jgi:hypothetical protein